MIDEEYHDPYQDAARIAIASSEARRRQALTAATAMLMNGSDEEFVRQDNFPVLVSQAVIIPYEKTDDGQLIGAATLPLRDIIRMIQKDPTIMYQIDPRKWEEIIAAAYHESGLFDEVTLTRRSGDDGRDVIAVKKGYGSVRLIESVKRYTPGRKVKASEVRDLLGAVLSDPQASKGILSTTWEFAPRIKMTTHITQYIPHRLELVNGTDLVQRLKEYTIPKNK